MPIIQQDHSLDSHPALVYAELRKASSQKKHAFRNVVLSTVSAGRPESRWVVFRKLTESRNLLVYTDARSAKVGQLIGAPACHLLFYNPRQGFQVRISGIANIHQNNELTKRHWAGVKSTSPRNYTTILPTGSPIQDPSLGNQWIDPTTDYYFTVIEITPSQIELVQLDRVAPVRSEFHHRDGNWEGSFLVP